MRKNDGFYNALSGLGLGRDVAVYNKYSHARLDKKTIDNLYAGSAIFARIIDKFPDDALRNWIDFQSDAKPEINARIRELGVRQAIRLAAKRERQHGGAAIYWEIDDGGNPNEPLNAERIKQIYSAHVFEADSITPEWSGRGASPDYYSVTGLNGVLRIHRSRLTIFPGIVVSDAQASKIGWGEPVAGRIFDAIMRLESINSVSANLAQNFTVNAWGIDGLNDLVESDDDEALKSRLEAKLVGVSIVNDVVIDSNDKYEAVTRNISGFDVLREGLERAVVQASGMPHNIVLGESTGSGLSDTGQAQDRAWKKSVSEYQEDKLRDKIEQVLYLICSELSVDVPEFEFKPLDVPTDAEIAETRMKRAQELKLYWDMGAITEHEIRANMPDDTMLDDDEYNRMLAAEAALNAASE